jgi:hypothetical protein
MQALIFCTLIVVFVSDFIPYALAKVELSYTKIKMVYCMKATLLLFCEVGVKQVLLRGACQVFQKY